eukprot:7547086-Alexandrium_andersonii.AAC.1
MRALFCAKVGRRIVLCDQPGRRADIAKTGPFALRSLRARECFAWQTFRAYNSALTLKWLKQPW